MKKAAVIICSIMALALFLIGTINPVAASSGKTYELKFQCQYPEMHFTVRNVFKPWMKEVQEKSGGKLKLYFFTQRAIVKEEETFDAIKNGLLDIGTASTGRTPGKFPLMDIATLPMLFTNAEVASEVLWELHKKYPEFQKEYKGTLPLFKWTSAQVQINMIKGQVKNLEDLKGKKIIGWIPPVLNLVKALGANAVQLPPMDTYLALERGMADGVATPYAILKPFKINEVAKYHTTGDLMMFSFFGAINPKKFNKLPKDLQKVLMDTTGDKMSRALGKSLDDAVTADVAWMKKKGNQFYALPTEERKKWAEAVSPLREKWLKKMEAKGYKNIREMLATTENLIASKEK